MAGKIFASLGDDDTAMGVKCPKEDRAELIAAEPEKFFLKEGHDDHYAWLRVRLAALEGADELAAILADAWRQVAPAACWRPTRSWRGRGGVRGRALWWVRDGGRRPGWVYRA